MSGRGPSDQDSDRDESRRESPRPAEREDLYDDGVNESIFEAVPKPFDWILRRISQMIESHPRVTVILVNAGFVMLVLSVALPAAQVTVTPTLDAVEPVEVTNNTSLGSGATVAIGDVAQVNGTSVTLVADDGARKTISPETVIVPGDTGDVSPEKFGLVNTSANRTCLRAAHHGSEQVTKTFVAEASGQLTGIVYTNVSVNKSVPEHREFLFSVASNTTPRNESLGRFLVSAGYAKVSPFPFTDRGDYLKLQQAARRADRGIWGCPETTPYLRNGTVGS